ncbi:Alpha/beta hydrolase fold-3 [Artemisia annua]|uniref:Alpha/beta hydrolase fold-3 n=1 Tax=Artemisia annua TaxID=35608 RepID=A0A2U1LWM3_ARTAN|nr:Alpha/beta hydrolase fold-3 [Artemisia annua]
MSDNQSQPIVINPDGSVTRNISFFPSSLPTPDEISDTLVLSKDVTINNINKTWVRIHIPKQSTRNNNPVKKLPVIVYYHGGGFVMLNASSTLTHDFCNELAKNLSVIVVSVDYRLAPEHRLPAAYEDGVEALHWIKSSQDPWLINFADLSNCYLMGTSAGANLAYHAGLRVSQKLDELEPLKIKGLILHHLFIGGVERTGSEIHLAEAGGLTLSHSDMLWDLSLPINASRDHEYSNLIIGGSDDMGRIKDSGLRVMVSNCYGDLLIDRQMEFAKNLELKGVTTECFYGEGYHGIELFDKSKATELFDVMSSFMSLSINGHNN